MVASVDHRKEEVNTLPIVASRKEEVTTLPSLASAHSASATLSSVKSVRNYKRSRPASQFPGEKLPAGLSESLPHVYQALLYSHIGLIKYLELFH